MKVSSKVPPQLRQKPITDYLADRFTYLPAETWADFVRQGRVSCNDIPCDLETLVSPGNVITCDLPDFTPPNVNLDYTIIYEDLWLLGVNKPGGLRVHSMGKYVTANLIYHLRHQHDPPYPEVHLVNRLDADTSGVVLLARDKDTVREMGEQFQAGRVVKEYVAVVAGVPALTEGEIDLPIGKVSGSKVKNRQGVIEGDGGKTAVTRYQLLKPLGQDHALLKLQPKTGRTHQLRLHLAAIGHPIVGDALYTMDDDEYLAWCQQRQPAEAMMGMNRQALHCQLTRFVHPITAVGCTLTALLPADISQLIARLVVER